MNNPVAVQQLNSDTVTLFGRGPRYSSELLRVVQVTLTAGWWVVFGKVCIDTAVPTPAIVQLRARQGQTILDEIAHPYFQDHFYRLQATVAVDQRRQSDVIDIACWADWGFATGASLMAIKVNDVKEV